VPALAACAERRGGRNQLPSTIPRSPGIIPVVLAVAFFRPLRCDCSFKERGRRWMRRAESEGVVLHNRFTGRSGE